MISPTTRLGFVVEGFKPDGHFIAEKNHGVSFDCFHTFDPIHLSVFLEQFPPILHEWIALYMMLVLVDADDFDALVDLFLKPALKRLPYYQELPGWLEKLKSDQIFDFFVDALKKVNGFENLETEFSIIKRKLLRASNRISLEEFKKHTNFDKIFGFVDQIHLRFLDAIGSVTKATDTERHLLIKVGDREIPVHLFGTDSSTYREDMRIFAFEQGLRIPYDHEDEQVPDASEVPLSDLEMKLKNAKKLQCEYNTKVFETSDLNERLKRAEKIYKCWMEFMDCGFSHPFILSNEITRKLAYLEVHNLGMSILFAPRPKHEKKLPLEVVVANARKQIQKITHSFTMTLLDLIPNKGDVLSGVDLKAGLEKQLNLVHLSQEALAKFKKGELSAFDPSVGDSMCQTRAVELIEIFNNSYIHATIDETLERLKQYADIIQDLFKKIPNRMGPIDTLKGLLEENRALFDIPEKITVLISSYILTKNRLSPENGLSKLFAKALSRQAQMELSKSSVNYLQRIALELLGNNEEQEAASLLFSHWEEDVLHRLKVPFYPSMRLLLNRLSRKQIPVVVKIKQYLTNQSKHYGKGVLLFTSQGGPYYVTSNLDVFSGKAVVVFSAKSITDKERKTADLMREFVENGLETYIYCASSDHPQGVKMDLDRTLEEYREKAHKLGACKDNPRVFLVHHVYCKLLSFTKKSIQALRVPVPLTSVPT